MHNSLRRFSPAIAAFLTFCLGIGTLFIQWKEDLQVEQAKEIKLVIDSIDNIFTQAESLANITRQYLGMNCSEDIQRNLSRLTASSDKIRSINIIQNGEWHCSSLEGRQSLYIKSSGLSADKIQIEFIRRQDTDMYMVYFPYGNNVIATAIFKSAIDKLMEGPHSYLNAAIQLHLTDKNETVHSEKYPFSLSTDYEINLWRFVSDNIYLLLFLIAVAILIHRFLVRAQIHSPVATLENAIKLKQFIPYYQPIIRLTDRKIMGAEVLMRWQHPEKGIIFPGEFIATAENNNLITQMTINLLPMIESDMTKLRTISNTPFHIALNISPISLKDNNFINACEKLIITLKKKAISVMIEITERQQMGSVSSALERLRQTGASIALDDFGTGYSNYSSLQKTMPDFIKIDKMFIDSLGKEGVNESIVSNIVTLSRSLSIPLIAEGVETTTQEEQLKIMGVEYAQGYLYSKAVPIKTLTNSAL